MMLFYKYWSFFKLVCLKIIWYSWNIIKKLCIQNLISIDLISFFYGINVFHCILILKMRNLFSIFYFLTVLGLRYLYLFVWALQNYVSVYNEVLNDENESILYCKYCKYIFSLSFNALNMFSICLNVVESYVFSCWTNLQTAFGTHCTLILKILFFLTSSSLD